MIKAWLVLEGGIFPIQVRKRTLKYLYGAMYNEFLLRTRFQRFLKRLFDRKSKHMAAPNKKKQKHTMVPVKKEKEWKEETNISEVEKRLGVKA